MKRIKEPKIAHLRDASADAVRFCKSCCSTKNVLEEQIQKSKSFWKGKHIIIQIVNNRIYAQTKHQSWKITFNEKEQRFRLWRQKNKDAVILRPEQAEYVRCKKIKASRDLKRLLEAVNEAEERYAILEKMLCQVDDAQKYASEKKMKMDLDDQRVYVRTVCGCRMIGIDTERQRFLLYHRNQTNEFISLEQARSGAYHKQGDRPIFASALDAVKYIYAHDNAKVISGGDYKKLPQGNRKQKQYYRQAKDKAKKQAVQRLESLFSELEHGNNYRELSVW